MNEFRITPVAQYTVVHDVDENRVLMRFAGILPLPVGAEIELLAPNINATVVRVRLLASTDDEHPATVCLDVKRPLPRSERPTKKLRVVRTHR